MAISRRARWLGYVMLLAMTLAAARWAGGQDPPAGPVRPERAERPSGSRDVASEPLPELAIDKLGRRAPAASAKDLFPATSWEQQARAEQLKNNPPPKPAPPPPPQAPPLPFTYMGKMIEDGKVTVFLVRGDRNVIARAGDTIEGVYRVDSIDDRFVQFTYLPLNQTQQLAFGAAS